MRIGLLALTALTGLASLACGAPQRRELGSPDSIARPEAAHFSPADAFGHQIIVTTSTTRMFAELVACDEDFVYLHLNSGGKLAWSMVPWRLVERAEIPTPGTARVTAITTMVVGSVSTLTQGRFLIFSVPVWAAAGVPSIVWSINDERILGKCQQIHAYSRYPEGMPPVIHERYWGSPSLAALPLPVPPVPRPLNPP